MTSKKDAARIEDLSRMVDRLHRRLAVHHAHANTLARMLEIIQEKYGMSDDEVDAIRKQAVGVGEDSNESL